MLDGLARAAKRKLSTLRLSTFQPYPKQRELIRAGATNKTRCIRELFDGRRSAVHPGCRFGRLLRDRARLLALVPHLPHRYQHAEPVAQLHLQRGQRHGFTTTGDGTGGVLLWGAQLETGDQATPYVLT